MWKQLDVEGWNARRRGSLSKVMGPVKEIVEAVRERGDVALHELTERFDKVELDDIRVTEAEIEEAYSKVPPELVDALRTAEKNIRAFHALQRPADMWLRDLAPGLSVGVKTSPLRRIGAYVPGGRAAYPSTVLMCAVPAKVAGVREIVMCTPPPVNPLTLVAADIAGVDEVYKAGGAQAIAAMALGTDSIAPVQKIVGPGNVYVTAAKMLLRDEVDIDFPAGPSEIAVLADESAEPSYIAADILAQAEHDPNAACILVTTDQVLANKVGRELEKQLARSDRQDVLKRSMDNIGYTLATDLRSAAAVVDMIAPEHLSIQVSDPLAVLNGIHNAGSIFVGRYAAVACGDYASGTNHVLPTAGYASTYSGLDVMHFMKRSSVQVIKREGLEAIGDTVEALAKAEGLTAHARSVSIRRQH
ncbi:histidinol dehydrogenase [Methanomassiliicoccales archaeon RumEn M1]|nr:histidinol dehydrogenase [Methanomassiliicoccales archaeon RumEn M1]